jgi:Ser/Thr protein kinase RdoA (MazF antagonist)
MDKAAAEAAYGPAARAALEAFPVTPSSIAFVTLSENITFRVRDDVAGAGYVLRLHRPGYNSLEALKAERAWTRALSAAGVAAPEPVATHDGRDYVEVAVPAMGERRHAGLARWVEGEVMADTLTRETDPVAAEACFESLGGLMAAMHDHASAWTPPDGFHRRVLDAEGLMGAAPLWGPFWEHPSLASPERALLLAVRDRIREALVRLGQDAATYGLIHADLHPGNVVIGAEGLAVIDFDDTAFGWHLYDLAVALQAYQADAALPGYRDACLRGYARARPLPPGTLDLLPMFVLARSLAQLGWLGQRPELPLPPDFPQRKARLLADAERFEPPI